MLRYSMMVKPQKRAPEVMTFTTSGAHNVPVPSGALLLTAECIASGGNTVEWAEPNYYGGGGGAYSKIIDYSLTGVTSFSVGVGDSTEYGSGYSTVSVSGGGAICHAASAQSQYGGLASNGIGDVRYSGGDGGVPTFGQNGGGGGAANDGGNGGNASGATPGAAGAGTAPSGAGGQLYGGGGQRGVNSGYGLRGWVKLTFTF
jgi:hypothetical protein